MSRERRRPGRWPGVPYRYPDREALKARIVAWIAAGGQMARIGAEPGMPCQGSVNGWARRDAAFAEALRVAYLQRADRTLWRFDEARAEAVLVRVRAGETLEAVLRRPDTPGRRVFYHWMGQQAHICEEVMRLRAERELARQHAVRQARWRAFDPKVADKILARVGQGQTLRAVLRSDRMFPSLMVLARWRAEQRWFDNDLKVCLMFGRLARGKARVAAATEAITERVMEGESLRSIARDPDAPCLRTLMNWRNRRGDFARELKDARAIAEQADADDFLDRMLALPKTATRAQIAPLAAELKRREAKLRRERGEVAEAPGPDPSPVAPRGKPG